MVCIVNKASMHTLYYVDIVVFFNLVYYVDINGSAVSLRCKCVRAIFLLVLSKKDFTEYEHGYVYITKHRYVIRRYYLLCETLVELPTRFVEASRKGEARRAEQSYSWQERRERNGYIADLLLSGRSELNDKSGIYYIIQNSRVRFNFFAKKVTEIMLGLWNFFIG